MEIRGTVQGEAACKFAGFTYRKPLKAHIDIWQLDPERLHPAHEYPRSTNPPSNPDTRAVELADYALKVGAPCSDGRSTVQIWMLPNEFTASKAPMLVSECSLANAEALNEDHWHEVLDTVFHTPIR